MDLVFFLRLRGFPRTQIPPTVQKKKHFRFIEDSELSMGGKGEWSVIGRLPVKFNRDRLQVTCDPNQDVSSAVENGWVAFLIR